MRSQYLVAAAILTGVLAASGFALAQGTEGGSTGPSQGGGEANGVYPAPTQGVEQDPTVTGSTPMPAHPTDPKKHAKKPMNDTTNTPGANSGSDAKGQ